MVGGDPPQDSLTVDHGACPGADYAEVSYARRSSLDGDDEAKWTAIVARTRWLGDCEPH